MPVFGDRYCFPLRIQRMASFADPDFDLLPGNAVMMTTLVFRLVQRDWKIDNPLEWECMGCAEAGNSWVGQDPRPHCEAHQMGIDYLLEIQAKQKRNEYA